MCVYICVCVCRCSAATSLVGSGSRNKVAAFLLRGGGVVTRCRLRRRKSLRALGEKYERRSKLYVILIYVPTQERNNNVRLG